MSSLSQSGRHRKAQALPLHRMARNQKGDPRGLQKVGANSANFKEKVEVPKRYCHASSQRKQMEQGSFQYDKVGVREAQKQRFSSRGLQRAMLPLTAPCWVPLASGEHVVGQWCSWITMKSWGPCTGCTARWKQKSRSSAPSRGQS